MGKLMRQCGRTYDWWPSEMLSKEHALLLFGARHVVYSNPYPVVLPAKSTCADATRFGRVYCARCVTGRPLLAQTLMHTRLAFLSWTRAWGS